MKVYIVYIYNMYGDSYLRKIYDSADKVLSYITEYLNNDSWFNETIIDEYKDASGYYDEEGSRFSFEEFLEKAVKEGYIEGLFNIEVWNVE